ncbi:MAG: hypothetical protein HY097_00275 [Nitrospinae bacterium]|nr:hypothetical protein [Nitrospinota bacterium]
MTDRYYLMFSDDIAGRFRQLSLPKNIAKGFFVLIGIVLVISVFLFYRHIKLSTEVIELEGLRKETREQRLQIQQFVQKVKDFEQQITRLERFDRKLRVITSLEGSGVSEQKWGMGGPDYREIDLYTSIMPDEGGKAIDKLNRDIWMNFSRDRSRCCHQRRQYGP